MIILMKLNEKKKVKIEEESSIALIFVLNSILLSSSNHAHVMAIKKCLFLYNID